MTNATPPLRRRRERGAAPALDAPLGSVTITAREVYDAVMALTTEVKTALDRSQKTAEKVDDHEGRLSTLEAARWPLPAAATVLGVLSLIVAVIAAVRS